MTGQARRDTQPELLLRRELWRRGSRYRVDQRPIAGMRRRADLLFTRAHVAVFVDGCFWHCCPEHGTAPRANAEWWRSKLAANVRRDRDTDTRLVEAGWTPIRVWEHEAPPVAADRIEWAVHSARISEICRVGSIDPPPIPVDRIRHRGRR
jgi:DNA mismatch endonuclease (patch repair protein)